MAGGQMLSTGPGAGPAQQVGNQLLGLRFGVDVQVGEPAGQQPVGAAHGVGPVELGLQAYAPPVQLLSDRVGANGLLERGQCPLVVADGLAQLG
jgi:hypothetical protein